MCLLKCFKRASKTNMDYCPIGSGEAARSGPQREKARSEKESRPMALGVFARSGEVPNNDRASFARSSAQQNWVELKYRPIGRVRPIRSGGCPINAKTRFLNGGINMYLYLRVLDYDKHSILSVIWISSHNKIFSLSLPWT